MQGSVRYVPSRGTQAATTDPPRSVEVARAPRPKSRRLLRKSDLENKLLITRTTGRQFGIVGEAWVEPRRLHVQSFDVSVNTLPLKPELRGNVPLKEIREVGDVVLIHSDQDFKPDASAQRLNLMAVTGLKLILDNGTPVGRCVDFVFDPESGRIVKLVFHTVNFFFAKEKWFDQYVVNVQDISRIVVSERVIYLRNEASWKKVAVGEYQFLADLVPSFARGLAAEPKEESMRYLNDSPPVSDLRSQYAELLEESRRQQQEYYAKYGPPPSPDPKRRSAKRRPSLASEPRQTPAPSRRDVRIDDWLKKEERELFMQE